MSKNSMIAVVVIIVLVVFGVFLFSKQQAIAPTQDEIINVPSTTDTSSTVSDTSVQIPPSDGSLTQPKEVVITNTDSGFSPSSVTIKVGDKITFKNESSQAFWPASAVHPTHTVYPGSDIKKCNTSAESGIFDTCRGVPSGSSWSFTFTHSGDWKYHDHLNPRQYGSIIVQ